MPATGCRRHICGAPASGRGGACRRRTVRRAGLVVGRAFARRAHSFRPCPVHRGATISGRFGVCRLVVGLVSAVLVAGTLVAVGTPVAQAATRGQVVQSAASYAASRGYHVGIAVLDSQSGAVYAGGYADDSFVSASVVKVLVAARLLLAGRMHGQVAALAYKMITQSDNAATNRLYPLAGGGSLEPWLASHYHVARLGSPTPRPGWWGYTRLVPRGLVQLYAKLKRDPVVGPWLLRTMREIRRYSSGGDYQWWGLPSATSGAAVKQGWDIAYRHANVNTTGFVNGDRYAVAILTRGPQSSYLSPISRVVTQTARLVLPNGSFPDDLPAVTGLSDTTAATGGGGSLIVHGRVFTGVSRVLFGSQGATNLKVWSPTTLSVSVPPHAAGWVDVRVVTSHGSSAAAHPDRFRFVPTPTVARVQPAHGATGGGNTVTISGSGFLDVQRVLFAGTAAGAVTTINDTTVRVTAPAHPLGQVTVRVVTGYGTSPVTGGGRYLYDVPVPAVTGAHGSGTSGSVALTWTNPATAGFAGVKICRSTGNSPAGRTCPTSSTVPAPAASFTDTGLNAGTTYHYTLFTVDRLGQRSSGVFVSTVA